jgi:hypothetical protein
VIYSSFLRQAPHQVIQRIDAGLWRQQSTTTVSLQQQQRNGKTIVVCMSGCVSSNVASDETLRYRIPIEFPFGQKGYNNSGVFLGSINNGSHLQMCSYGI